jgi:magnesium-transporting ATPase (P-type)
VCRGFGMWLQSKIAEACQLLEKDLELLGASAIEDKLQVGRIV